MNLRFQLGARLALPVSFKSRTSRIRLSIAVLGFPCYFIDGRISIQLTAGVLRRYRIRRRQDFLVSLLPNVHRVGD